MPTWFRIVAALAVLWNMVGVYSYLEHIGVVTRAMTPEQQALAATIPGWITAVFAIAVFSALVASLAMLAGRYWARGLFALSLLCIVVQMGWILFVSDARAVEGPLATIMPLVVMAIGALLLWLASMGVRKGWLR